MRKTIIGFTLLIISQIIYCQDKNDIGFTFGASYYQGDLNPQKIFATPNIHLGGFLRININDIISVRSDFGYFGLSGENIGTSIPSIADDYRFDSNIINAGIKLETNFFKYSDVKKNTSSITPYITIGIAGIYDFKTVYPSIPFGGGLKIKLSDRITAGLEWTYHKTFTDKIDGVLNGYDNLSQTNTNTSSIYNNDWYSLCGFHISYKMKSASKKCATYSN
ncbi:MAG: outer membrane beta-barrel protein [Bacteroidales bacterium]|nr:outer membrane beta-barrel protein [Bacteroidales bacterium]